MTPSPGFWAAVRLAAFANLEVTRENWKSFARTGGVLSDAYRRDAGRFQPAPAPTDERAGLLKTLAHVIATSGRDSRVAEFWREILRKKGLPEKDLNPRPRRFPQRPLGSPSLLTPSTTPLSLWPTAPRFAVLKRLHDRTRTELNAICRDDDLTPLAQRLERYREPRPPLLALGSSAGAVRRTALFVQRPDPRRETLGEHLDRLLVATACGGWFKWIYRCAWCDAFAVRRLHTDRGRFCGGMCRATSHATERKARTAERLSRAVMELQRRRRELRHGDAVSALDSLRADVARRHRITVGQLERAVARQR